MAHKFNDKRGKRLDLGSHRILPVKKTLSLVAPIAEKIGITRVADITGLDRIGIPVSLAIRPNSKSVAVSQGKGISQDYARASALMESIEIWHAENMEIPVLYGDVQTLQKQFRIVEIDDLPKTPQDGFSNHVKTLWVTGIELFTDEQILLPYEMVHADYTRPIPSGQGFFPASTNGLASGNSKLEAVCHAICEVIERDALSLWHFTDPENRLAKRINPESVEDPDCQSLLRKFEDAGLDFLLWDITTDTKIPCILCTIVNASNSDEHIGLGSGCHPSSAIALRRAITEAAQTRLNYISGARDDLLMREYETEELKSKFQYAIEYLHQNGPMLTFSSIKTWINPSLESDLDLLLQNLSAVGIKEVIWTDLSHEDFQIPVARIVIPGLEAPHDDANYVAGPRARKVIADGQ